MQVRFFFFAYHRRFIGKLHTRDVHPNSPKQIGRWGRQYKGAKLILR